MPHAARPECRLQGIGWPRGRAGSAAPTPQTSKAILAEADCIMRGEREVFGRRWAPAGERRWRRDFLSGAQWPARYHRCINLNRVRSGSDIKIPWELSRFQHAVKLSQAYVISHDERYVQYLMRDIQHWMCANQIDVGVNWTCSMEVAIRICNWLVARELCMSAEIWTSSWDRRVMWWAREHRRHIMNNLEDWGDKTQNHYLANLVGVMFVSLSLRSVDESRFLAMWSAGRIEDCMLSQVYQDGVSFENSTSYHKLVLEMFTYAMLAAEHCGIVFSEKYHERLHRMFKFLANVNITCRGMSQIGDGDDGRFLIFGNYFGRRPLSADYLTAIGTRVCHASLVRGYEEVDASEAEWVVAGEDVEASGDGSYGGTGSWHLGEGGGSVAFPEGGVYVLKSAGLAVVANCAVTGVNGYGPHRHNDALSFDVAVAGESVVVDPGTFCYQSDAASRRSFRRTAAHNTVVMDGVEQNAIDDLFALRANRLHVRVAHWGTNDERDCLQAELTLDTPQWTGLTHRRTWRLDKRKDSLTVLDEILGSGRHSVAWFLHFAPEASPVLEQSTSNSWTIVTPRARFELSILAEAQSTVLYLSPDWVSRSYRKRESARTASLMAEDAAVPCTIRLEVLLSGIAGGGTESK